MTDSLGDILGKKQLDEPPEIAIIKDFVQERFDTIPKVTLSDHQIVIGIEGAALAGTLRLYLHELEEKLNTNKRLSIRIV